jgi:RHS repeat-associated protein
MKVSKTQTLNIHTDHLGTPRRLADENGNIVWSWESEPFGESKAVGNVEFDLRFAGQYFDVETSTHYNINRDYDPKMGRYLQSDPIGFDGGVNSYVYVAGNPLVAVDEMGLVKTNWFINPPITYDDKVLQALYPQYKDLTTHCQVFAQGNNM